MNPYNQELANQRILRELPSVSDHVPRLHEVRPVCAELPDCEPVKVNRKQPRKDIEKVFIRSSGDPSVGIRAQSYEAEMFLPPECFDELEDIRSKFFQLYEAIAGETVSVMFDFEYQAMMESEKALDNDTILPYAPEVIQAMRDWLGDCYWEDMDDENALTEAEVLAGVARHFDGGIPAFMRTL